MLVDTTMPGDRTHVTDNQKSSRVEDLKVHMFILIMPFRPDLTDGRDSLTDLPPLLDTLSHYVLMVSWLHGLLTY